MNATEIIEEIWKADITPDDCERIVRAANAVKRQRAQSDLGSLREGDKVAFADSVRPRLLAGERATVVGFTNSKILVMLDHSLNNKWRATTKITCEPVHLIRVS